MDATNDLARLQPTAPQQVPRPTTPQQPRPFSGQGHRLGGVGSQASSSDSSSIAVGTRLRHPSGLVTRVNRIEDGWVYYDDQYGGRIQLTRLQELVRAGGTQVLPRFSEQTPPFSGEGHRLGGMELDGME